MSWMLYGAYGFTGRLIAEEAIRRGQRPILAGRSAEKVKALGEQLGLPWAAFALEDTQRLHAEVAAVDLVLHAAGPFAHTGAAMLAACLEGKTHYLDITGEVPYLERVFTWDEQARLAGIALLPGVGFDVVPSDCLANLVCARLPQAVELEIGVNAIGRPSGGTARSMLEMISDGGLMRRDGRLVSFPLGQGARWLRFPHASRMAIPAPWGDLATAFHSTGVKNITTYLSFPPRLIRLVRATFPLLRGALRIQSLRRLAQAGAGRVMAGPSAAELSEGKSYLWARAATAHGQEAQAWLETPDGYRLTALTAVRSVERMLANPSAGALTPAQAFGMDYILTFEGVRLIEAP